MDQSTAPLVFQYLLPINDHSQVRLSLLNPAEPYMARSLMSPTSYEAAPLRISSVAEECGDA